MKKLLIACLLLALGAPSLKADEGMWLLPYLEKLNIRDMKAKGFKLSAKDIYNLNGDAIKDAIVIFGNGCTGEIVSDRGLLLTNHHCGFDAIEPQQRRARLPEERFPGRCPIRRRFLRRV